MIQEGDSDILDMLDEAGVRTAPYEGSTQPTNQNFEVSILGSLFEYSEMIARSVALPDDDDIAPTSMYTVNSN